jgi:hypothetical protein
MFSNPILIRTNFLRILVCTTFSVLVSLSGCTVAPKDQVKDQPQGQPKDRASGAGKIMRVSVFTVATKVNCWSEQVYSSNAGRSPPPGTDGVTCYMAGPPRDIETKRSP